MLERVESVTRVVQRSPHRPPRWVQLLSVPLVVAVVAFGVWLTGAVLTDDAAVAMVLTGGWFAVAGALALVAALRWRGLAVPVLSAYAVSAAVIGGFLLYTSNVDRVVDEDVIVAAPGPDRGATSGESNEPAPDTTPGQADGSRQGPRKVAEGAFRSQAHETSGVATLVERSGGDRVLTLTDFETDPGPDLRVYLVRGDGSRTAGAVDLGGLKGNKGNQQYDVPTGAPTGAVVIWCRAFSVGFGAATLS